MQGKTDDVMKYRFTLNTGDKFDCAAFDEEDGLGSRFTNRQSLKILQWDMPHSNLLPS